jgi:preprotein translocase subunit SecF
VTEDQIRRALRAIPHEVQTYGDPGAHQMLIRLPQTQAAEQGGNLSADVGRVRQMLEAADLPPFQIEGTEIVGPTVGAALRRQAIYATLLSMFGITAWIAIRFRVSFALGSILATFHDVLVTLAFLAFARYEMSLNVIAAMLTMVGYSMNDMIVIFDRVRENTRLSRREPLESAINTSLNQTLTRTVITRDRVLAVLASISSAGRC